MRCPFCHNMNLVTSNDLPEYSMEYILDFLAKRHGVLDGVCITGGEPTLYPDLPDFISSVKELGYMVKLDTNGTNPGMLRSLSENKLVDYVAMDIKASLSDYGLVCGVSDIDTSLITDSVSYLLSGDVEYEFRTTAVEEFLTDECVTGIASLIKGAKRYYLQGYVESEFVPDKTLHPVPKEKLLQYVQELSGYIDLVEIRGL